MAATNDPTTWSSFQGAAESKVGDGLDCVVTDGFVVIDLDKVRDPEPGLIETWAQAIIDEYDSYTEIIPSKRGGTFDFVAKSQPGGTAKAEWECTTATAHAT